MTVTAKGKESCLHQRGIDTVSDIQKNFSARSHFIIQHCQITLLNLRWGCTST